MSTELLSVLEHIEREKGISKEKLIEAVEQALVSAVKKMVDVDLGVEVKVTLDKETGKIKAYVGKKEFKSIELGRIAAQTAKQVIIQRIREAEKELIFSEFQGKVGQIASGTVYRFERDNIIVDLLGKTEAFLPKREQCFNESFKQGERISGYILDVKQQTRGPLIILSRSHPNFIRKLFELEVPEIYEGIVEIKAISRQAGERTKIAVWSKDEKIDSLGSCVGMRGTRVKNIVNELHGEKIDIVRYKDDIKEYIIESLSPAKISEIKLDKENKKAEIIVADDQLSLAIGKHGQNVRLASKLVSWELDIRTRETAGMDKKEITRSKEKDLGKLEGIGEKLQNVLTEGGFDSVEKIANSDLKDIISLKGIGKAKGEKIIKSAKKLMKG
ncbi:MAG: transcription termination factor NusA [Candidatus Gygaella obscura]|nr:transcription termination factor NusA [Candidatus Gygaella obscura]